MIKWRGVSGVVCVGKSGGFQFRADETTVRIVLGYVSFWILLYDFEEVLAKVDGVLVEHHARRSAGIGGGKEANEREALGGRAGSKTKESAEPKGGSRAGPRSRRGVRAAARQKGKVRR